MKTLEYNRQRAVEYAKRWALSRNPVYYDFENAQLGGDCTNFVSQCLFAACRTMNYTKVFGWYYINLNQRSPSWTGVEAFYNFLVRNKSIGPFGEESNLKTAQAGDIIQLSFNGEIFAHSLIVVETGNIPDEENILIACHTYDSLMRPLSSYNYEKLRLIKILGVRV